MRRLFVAEPRVMADARRSKVWTRVVQEYGERSNLQINEVGGISPDSLASL